MKFSKPYADFVQRLRVPMGFLLLACFVWLARPSKVSLVVGIPVSLLGLALRAWAAGHLAKNEALATSGPYGHVRNPLYLGTLITAAGLAVAAWHAGVAVLFGSVFLLVYFPAIQLEEEHLRKLFPEFAAYERKVPAMIPLARSAVRGKEFRGERYRRNEEYKALLGWLAAVGWLMYRGI